MLRPIGCSTITFRQLALDAALDAISARGIAHADLCIIPGACPHADLSRDISEEAARIAELFRARRVTPVSLNVHVGYLNMPNAAAVAEQLRRAAELARRLEVRVVTIPCGARIDPRKWDAAIARTREHLLQLIDDGHERGVEFSIEIPHKGCLGETVEDAARFFDQIGDPRLKCTLDTSHVIAGGEPSLARGLAIIGPARINHVHLRDAVDRNIMVTPGRGRADFAELFRALDAAGYTGAMTLELELRGAGAPRMAAELGFARRHLDRLLTGGKPALRDRIEESPPVAFLRRLSMNPIEEIKRSPRAKAAALFAMRHGQSIIPSKIYDGHWRRRLPFPHLQMRVRKHERLLEKQPSRPIRACVAGSGYAGVMHALGLYRLEGVEVVGVSDLEAAKAGALAERIGSRSFISTQEMIESEKPDLVAIATGEWQHHEVVKDSFDAGAGVFCEKSLTPTMREAEELVALARERSLFFAMNYNYRFMPGIRRVRGMIQAATAGPLVLANIKVHGAAYHHVLDLIRFFGGEIATVTADYVNEDALRPFGMVDWRLWDPDILYVPSRSLALIARMKSGAHFVITSSFLHDPKAFILSLDMVFERGALALTGMNLHDTFGRLTTTGDFTITPEPAPPDQPSFALGYDYSFFRAVESAVNAFIAGRAPESSGQDGLDILRLERAISRSNTTGRRIDLATMSHA